MGAVGCAGARLLAYFRAGCSGRNHAKPQTAPIRCACQAYRRTQEPKNSRECFSRPRKTSPVPNKTRQRSQSAVAGPIAHPCRILHHPHRARPLCPAGRIFRSHAAQRAGCPYRITRLIPIARTSLARGITAALAPPVFCQHPQPPHALWGRRHTSCTHDRIPGFCECGLCCAALYRAASLPCQPFTLTPGHGGARAPAATACAPGRRRSR